MTKDVFLTLEKLQKLKEELGHLKSERRPDVIARIKDARALGDLSENAEYHSAREEQAFVEGRIEELEYMIKKARLIKEGGSGKDSVEVGSMVVCNNEEYGEKVTFNIVGSAEVDISSGKISNESPIGRALMGKKKGEVVEVAIPAGIIKYKILEVR